MRRCLFVLCCVCLMIGLTAARPILAAEEPGDKDDASKTAASKKVAANVAEKEDAAGPEKPETDQSKAERAEAEKPEPAKPDAYTVKKEPLRIELGLDGVFEAAKATGISLRPEAWSTLKVLKAVEHGTVVEKGDLLLALELEKIDQAIADLRTENELADLSLRAAEQQLRSLEQTTPMDLEAAERAYRVAKEDAEYYFEVARPLNVKAADFSLKSAEEYLEYQREEVRQLEKMYKADDLTEETEEIILKRARNALERAEFRFEEAKIQYKRSKSVTIPRQDETVKESFKRAEVAVENARAGIPTTLEKLRLETEKLRVARARSEEKLEDLLADRAAMTVRAPVAGVVYHGKATRGKFSTGNASNQLNPGSTLAANNVFMTIVQPRPMSIRTSVPEKELHKVAAGIQGTAVPTAFPEMKLTAIVGEVAAIPLSSGDFDAQITVALGPKADALMPGMTCKVELTCYENKEAIAVPPKALGSEDTNGEKSYVYVLGKKDQSKKRYVTVGKRTADKVEILGGLKAGEKILAECPKDK